MNDCPVLAHCADTLSSAQSAVIFQRAYFPAVSMISSSRSLATSGTLISAGLGGASDFSGIMKTCFNPSWRIQLDFVLSFLIIKSGKQESGDPPAERK